MREDDDETAKRVCEKNQYLGVRARSLGDLEVLEVLEILEVLEVEFGSFGSFGKFRKRLLLLLLLLLSRNATIAKLEYMLDCYVSSLIEMQYDMFVTEFLSITFMSF